MGHAYVSAGEAPCRMLLICAPGEPLGLVEGAGDHGALFKQAHPGE